MVKTAQIITSVFARRGQKNIVNAMNFATNGKTHRK